MPNFYWLAMRDNSWHEDTLGRMDRVLDRILPFQDGSSATRSPGGNKAIAGAWTDLRDGDLVWIPVHGRKKSTETVAWVVNGTEIDWTAEQVAQAVYGNLFPRMNIAINYHLLACFGANSIIPFGKSFGEKLAKAMSVLLLRGSLTAYKGATGMAAHRGMQVGSSRITAAPVFFFHRGAGKPRGDIAIETASHSWPLSGPGG